MRDSLSGRQRKRRLGYTKDLAHMAAHFTTGYQIGFDLDLLPRRGSGLIVFDLLENTATSDGRPFECSMLAWTREMIVKRVDAIGFGPQWLQRAVVKLRWTWLGEDYEVESTGEMTTEDASVAVTIRDTQPPLPSPLRKKPYDFTDQGG